MQLSHRSIHRLNHAVSNKCHVKVQAHCMVGVCTIHHSKALSLSTWAMLLPLAPTPHSPGGNHISRSQPKNFLQVCWFRSTLTDYRGPLCLTHCSLTPSKWRKIFLIHVKWRLLQRPQQLSYYESPCYESL